MQGEGSAGGWGRGLAGATLAHVPLARTQSDAQEETAGLGSLPCPVSLCHTLVATPTRWRPTCLVSAPEPRGIDDMPHAAFVALTQWVPQFQAAGCLVSSVWNVPPSNIQVHTPIRVHAHVCPYTRVPPHSPPLQLGAVSPGRFWGPDGGQTRDVCELHPSRLAWRMQNGTPGGKEGNQETWNSSQEKAADASTSRPADMLRKLSKASLPWEARASEATDSRTSVCLILRSGNTLRSEIKAFGNLDLESKSQHVHLNKSQAEELGHWLGWDPGSHPAPPFPSLVLPGHPAPLAVFLPHRLPLPHMGLRAIFLFCGQMRAQLGKQSTGLPVAKVRVHLGEGRAPLSMDGSEDPPLQGL